MSIERLTANFIILITALACLHEATSQAAVPAPPEIHCKHFLYRYPLGAPPSNDVVIRDLYDLSSNDGTNLADWVCYYLTCHEVEGDLD